MMIRSLLLVTAALMIVQSGPGVLYQDPARRFTFSYPSTFGSPAAGTDDGFEDRLAAVRFSTFPAVYGGEAVLTRGFPLVDLQAAGGLYDSLTLGVLPAPLRALVVTQLPRLTAANFCSALGQPQHLDPGLPAFASLTAQQRQAIGMTDMMRNSNPRVVDCRATNDTVTFDKERAFQPGYPAQHVYGAVRFLSGPYSTFQLIAGGAAPDRSTLATIEQLVASFQPR
jgi:hypothetical protein